MLVVGLVHLVLMIVKARNEERHLLAVHGDAYARYIERTGRFVPRLRRAAAIEAADAPMTPGGAAGCRAGLRTLAACLAAWPLAPAAAGARDAR